MSASKPIKIFFSYAHEDEELRNQLANHLSLFRNQGLIEPWHDREISAGTEWKNQIVTNLDAADIILLLVSSDFIASNYCYNIEMNRAMQRHESGEARVVPIILRPCEWMGAPFGALQAFPTDGEPVSSWENQDEAFANIAQGIKGVIDELRPSPPTPKASVGIKPISEIEAPESSPPAPASPAKRLRGWTIEERHWPLLLSFLIPLYLLAGSDITHPKFLTLTGITLLVAGILYWVVRRQLKRLWLGGPLGIVGSGLIVAAIIAPVCSQLKPISNKGRQESDKSGLAVTVAKFGYAGSDLKGHADSFNTKLIDQLMAEEAITTIKKYNYEVIDEQTEKIDTQVISEDCKCDVFITGVIKKSKDGEIRADLNLTNVANQSASNNGQQDLTPVKLEEITLKDQEDYSGLVSFLAGYAYYKWGKWQEAINQLEKLKPPDYKDFHGEMYFYIAMCYLQLGLQTQNAEQINNALLNFKYIPESSAEKSPELRVASRLNLTLAEFFSILLTPQAEAETETEEEAIRKATEEIDKVINELENLGKDWKPSDLGYWGGCNLAYTNLVMVLAKKYEITGRADGLLDQAQNAVKGINCPKEKAIGKLNFGNLLAEAARKSDTWDQFEKRLNWAVTNYKDALEYFKGAGLVQYQATTANNLASTLTDRAIYLGNESRDLKDASDLYEEVLRFLPKEKYLEDWAFTRYSQAFTFIELGKYEDAITACDEAIAIYKAIDVDGKSRDLYWADAKSALGKARYLKGRDLLDKGMLSDAVAACNDAKTVYAPDTEDWVRAEKTRGDACLQLIALDQGAARAIDLQCARQSYGKVQSLCDPNNLVLQKLCEEVKASQNLLPRN